MTSVERVKAICKERRIAISRRAKTWGFPTDISDSLEKAFFQTIG